MYDFKNKMKFFFLLCIFRILTETVVVDFRYRRSLSAGRELSLLGLCPVGSQLSRYSRRSRAPSATINYLRIGFFTRPIKNDNLKI